MTSSARVLVSACCCCCCCCCCCVADGFGAFSAEDKGETEGCTAGEVAIAADNDDGTGAVADAGAGSAADSAGGSAAIGAAAGAVPNVDGFNGKFGIFPKKRRKKVSN